MLITGHQIDWIATLTDPMRLFAPEPWFLTFTSKYGHFCFIEHREKHDDVLSHDCRVSLYRIIWESGEGSVQVFALESTRDAARRFFEATIALIAGRPGIDLELYNLV